MLGWKLDRFVEQFSLEAAVLLFQVGRDLLELLGPGGRVLRKIFRDLGSYLLWVERVGPSPSCWLDRASLRDKQRCRLVCLGCLGHAGQAKLPLRAGPLFLRGQWVFVDLRVVVLSRWGVRVPRRVLSLPEGRGSGLLGRAVDLFGLHLIND